MGQLPAECCSRRQAPEVGAQPGPGWRRAGGCREVPGGSRGPAALATPMQSRAMLHAPGREELSCPAWTAAGPAEAGPVRWAEWTGCQWLPCQWSFPGLSSYIPHTHTSVCGWSSFPGVRRRQAVSTAGRAQSPRSRKMLVLRRSPPLASPGCCRPCRPLGASSLACFLVSHEA